MQGLLKDPGFKAAYENMQKLHGDLQEASRKLTKAQRSPRVRPAKAMALVVGHQPDQQPAGAVTEVEIAKLESDRNEIAVALDAQREVIAELQARLSQRACRERLPEYQAAVRKVLDAAKALAVAYDGVKAVRGSISSDGFHLDHPINFLAIRPLHRDFDQKYVAFLEAHAAETVFFTAPKEASPVETPSAAPAKQDRRGAGWSK